MNEIRNENGIEETERLDNEENYSFEDVKQWAKKQKQSMASD